MTVLMSNSNEPPARSTRSQVRKRNGAATRSPSPQKQATENIVKLKKSRESGSSFSVINPQTHHFEFGGPLGALGLLVGMPSIVLLLNQLCDEHGCPSYELFTSNWINTLGRSLSQQLFQWQGLVVYSGWIGWCVALYHILPGESIQGTPLRTGHQLTYKINGRLNFPIAFFF
jgi:delta14-sterol reductase